MKLNTTTLILGVAMAVVAGLFSMTVFGITETKTDAQSVASATGLITGHVTTTHKDAAGNILSYRQSDNLIVNQGENCVLKMLFATGGGSEATRTDNNVCTGANTQGFRYISIGNGSGSPASDDAKLHNPYNATGGVASLARQFSTISTTGWTNSTASTAGTFASVVMSATFTNGQTASQTVTESGLFNNTETNFNTDAMFARQTFNSISLSNGDSLTVQWTINVGGTTPGQLTP